MTCSRSSAWRAPTSSTSRTRPTPCASQTRCSAPTVLANLLRPLLLRLAETGFADGLGPDVLIASGLLAHEADEVATAFAASMGLRESARRHGGEWAALLLRR